MPGPFGSQFIPPPTAIDNAKPSALTDYRIDVFDGLFHLAVSWLAREGLAREPPGFEARKLASTANVFQPVYFRLHQEDRNQGVRQEPLKSDAVAAIAMPNTVEEREFAPLLVRGAPCFAVGARTQAQ